MLRMQELFEIKTKESDKNVDYFNQEAFIFFSLYREKKRGGRRRSEGKNILVGIQCSLKQMIQDITG